MSYEELFNKDYNLGTQNENNILPLLRSHFGDDSITKTANRYHPFDFRNEDGSVFYELKTRTTAKNQFPTTIISSTKIDYANRQTDKEFYFIFQFADEICFIKYDRESFNNYECRFNTRRDRNVVELNSYVFINTEDLITIKC